LQGIFKDSEIPLGVELKRPDTSLHHLDFSGVNSSYTRSYKLVEAFDLDRVVLSIPRYKQGVNLKPYKFKGQAGFKEFLPGHNVSFTTLDISKLKAIELTILRDNRT
jgi:hypothetical protein